MGKILENWEKVMESAPPTEEGQKGAACLILLDFLSDEMQRERQERERERQKEEQRRRDDAVRWVQRVKLPEGADMHTWLGLVCERTNILYPVGPASSHERTYEMPADGWVHIYERGQRWGGLELHAKQCSCTMQCIKLDGPFGCKMGP